MSPILQEILIRRTFWPLPVHAIERARSAILSSPRLILLDGEFTSVTGACPLVCTLDEALQKEFRNIDARNQQDALEHYWNELLIHSSIRFSANPYVEFNGESGLEYGYFEHALHSMNLNDLDELLGTIIFEKQQQKKAEARRRSQEGKEPLSGHIS